MRKRVLLSIKKNDSSKKIFYSKMEREFMERTVMDHRLHLHKVKKIRMLLIDCLLRMLITGFNRSNLSINIVNK